MSRCSNPSSPKCFRKEDYWGSLLFKKPPNGILIWIIRQLTLLALTSSFAIANFCLSARESIGMSIKRMDNVLIVVEDIEAVKAFFLELGMELEGETTVEGPWVDSTVGLKDVRADIATLRTPDGHGRVELTKFHHPPAVRSKPENAPANTLGIRRIMFAVDDIDEVVARLRSHGAELLGEIAQYEDSYRLCFLRGPEGIIIGVAEQLGDPV